MYNVPSTRPRARVIVCTYKDSFRNFNLCLNSRLDRDTRDYGSARPDGRSVSNNESFGVRSVVELEFGTFGNA